MICCKSLTTRYKIHDRQRHLSASNPKIPAAMDDIARDGSVDNDSFAGAVEQAVCVGAQPQADLGGGQRARLPDQNDGAPVQQQSPGFARHDCPISRVVAYTLLWLGVAGRAAGRLRDGRPDGPFRQPAGGRRLRLTDLAGMCYRYQNGRKLVDVTKDTGAQSR